MTECLDTRLLESDWAIQCCVILDARSLFSSGNFNVGKKEWGKEKGG
jgi:hypothetical protein